MKDLILVLLAWVAGMLTRRVCRFFHSAYHRVRLGVCWRYKPTGWLQTRNGTTSDFCQRCNHPRGYHL